MMERAFIMSVRKLSQAHGKAKEGARASGENCRLPRAGSGDRFRAIFASGNFRARRAWNLEIMKKEIHPKYDDATISCACGHVLKTRSTVKTMSINTCAACHPYFTGQAKFIDTEGRVDRFNKRYARKAGAK
jgi:large subunit ribosomal protein L31